MTLPTGYQTKNIGGKAHDDREVVIPGRFGHVTDAGVQAGWLHAIVLARSPRHLSSMLKRLPAGVSVGQHGDQEAVLTLRQEAFPAVAAILRLRARRQASEAQKQALARARAKKGS